MLSLKKSLDILKKTDALLEGHFVLSSGLHSSKYIQCAKLLSFPYLAEKICKSLANKIKKKHKNIDLILASNLNTMRLLSAKHIILSTSAVSSEQLTSVNTTR